MSAISQFLPYPALRRLLQQHSVDEKYARRAQARVRFSALLEPLRRWENLRWGGRIRRTEIAPSPVFLLGYGRSGTTHLHYLLWQDPQFGVVSNYLANFFPIALTGRGWLDKLFAGAVPSKRPMDNVAISLDAPQEEELALINATSEAPLHFMSFPRALPEIYDRWVCGLGANTADLETWKSAYLEVLQKATILSDGKRLALKTPTHTGRVPVLREMFPDAKFVNIVRNPYRVLKSMQHMYRMILPAQALQEIDWDAIDAWTLSAYRTSMMKYLVDRKGLASDQLFEIRYEDLDARPIETLRRMYETLDLGDFDAVEPRFRSYLDSLGTFEKNRFEFAPKLVETVNEHWGFAFDAFGYERIEPGERPRDHDSETP